MPDLLRVLWCSRNDGPSSHHVFLLYNREIPDPHVDLSRGVLVLLEATAASARNASKYASLSKEIEGHYSEAMIASASLKLECRGSVEAVVDTFRGNDCLGLIEAIIVRLPMMTINSDSEAMIASASLKPLGINNSLETLSTFRGNDCLGLIEA